MAIWQFSSPLGAIPWGFPALSVKSSMEDLPIPMTKGRHVSVDG